MWSAPRTVESGNHLELLGIHPTVVYNLAARGPATFTLARFIMVRLLASIALLAGVFVSAEAQPPAKARAKAAAFDPAAMIGDWEYVSGVKMGEKVEKDNLKGTVKIAKDKLTIPSGVADKPFVMAYKLDTKTTPVNIDMEIKDGPVAEGKAKGIVAFEGATLKICYHPTGGDRPKKFESTKDNGAFFFVLKKAAK
jgi:uncharacterized protein (TIGR03067 family)